MSQDKNTEFIKIYENKSELVHPDGRSEVFEEGNSDSEASTRYTNISTELRNGFLDNLIKECKKNPDIKLTLNIQDEHKNLLDVLVLSITSEVGRALVGLSVLQLVVKTMEPAQSIRLHKGGKTAYNFSWKGGISMRSLDKKYITPTLRKHNLLRLNADGFMMTRSLAENYPYSSFYKANLRGARAEWLSLVEKVETQELDAEAGLKYLIYRLFDISNEFDVITANTMSELAKVLKLKEMSNASFVSSLLERHIEESSYAARLMEIAMHSLCQALIELEVYPDLELKPLSQMRSANKKHGNIADIELMQDGQIIMAWDAKYGKTYLRDELEEIADKLTTHLEAKKVGFVTSGNPERLTELNSRILELEQLYGLELSISSFSDWVTAQYKEAESLGIKSSDIASAWLTAYTESLAQKRREVAPIDEPCQLWISDLLALYKSL